MNQPGEFRESKTQVIPLICQVLLNDESPLVRAKAAEALGKMDADIPEAIASIIGL